MTNDPAPTNPADGYPLTLLQAARLLAVRPKTLQRAVKAGHLPHLCLPTASGLELRFRAEDLLALPPHLLQPPKARLLATPAHGPDSERPDQPPAERKRRKKAGKGHPAGQNADTAPLTAADADPTPPALPERPKTREQMALVAGQVLALDERLAEIHRQMGDMAGSSQALLQAQLEWGRRFAEASDRAERAAAEAAAYRERTAWLEGLLSDATRQLAELRALPAPAAAAPEPEPPAPALVPPPTFTMTPELAPLKPWWRRLFS